MQGATAVASPGLARLRERAGSRVAILLRRLFEPVDIASLVYFRIAFGLVMLWEVYRYFSNGWISNYWIEPSFHFTWPGFGWVQPWPGDWMYAHWAALGVLAACITVGLFYRLAIALFFLGFTYQFLLEQSRYLNHFYLIILMSLLLCFVPAHRAFSLDAWVRPALRSSVVPAWSLWLLRAQLGLVFFFAGVAKLNSDWLQGEPLRMWLAGRTDFPIIGRWFTTEWAPYLFSYGGLMLDLFLFPFIVWKRTRMFAFAAAVGFHLTNSQLFRIGIFPWLMIGACLLFFPPDWPRRVLRFLRVKVREAGAMASAPESLGRAQRAILVALGVWFAIQIALPLRHWAYGGNVSWTEEGHQFAWHMKLRDKNGRAHFVVHDPRSGRKWNIYPHMFLKSWQYADMARQPDMLLQYAHHLHRRLAAQGNGHYRVTAEMWVSLNGRPLVRMVDPNLDLARVERTVFGADWILPLREPLRRD